VQHAAHALPGLTSLLGSAYLTLHLTVTAGVLLWLVQYEGARRRGPSFGSRLAEDP
jgi:hypothetical protein